MNGEQWLVIPRWDGPDGFQHYRDRDPVWIKNYRRLLHSDEYRSLSMHQRGVLHGLWLEYAASNRQIRDSTLTITRALGQRVSRRTLDALNHAGFITFSAIKPLSPRYHDAMPETEREVEKEGPPLPPSRGGNDLDSNGAPEIVETVPCANCGKPVDRGQSCLNCGASPRDAGSSPRAVSKPKKKPPHTLAEAMTRNGGWQYELPAFREELDRYELTADERAKLLQLRDQLAARDAIATATDDNPFFQ